MNEKYGWKLQEIILVAMLCIVFGVVYLAGVYLASFLSTLLTPVGLAPWPTSSSSACGSWPPP